MNTDILLVTELFPPAVGGSAALLANVYSRLPSINVRVLADPVASGPIQDQAFPLPHEWTRIDGRKRGIRSAGEAGQHWRIARAIRAQAGRGRPTIVHAARPLPEGLPALGARYLGPGAPRYLSWAHGEEVAAALTSREHAWLAGKVCRGAAMMLASSRFASGLVASLGVPSGRIHVIHPGVDPGRFMPFGSETGKRERPVSGTHPTLLSVGRLQRRKGHDVVIEAVARLRPEFPELRYVIAGDGPERDRLKELVRKHSLEPHVSFLGSVSDDQLPGLYAACDIFLMPTRQDGPDVEGFGIVYLEAAAAGKPTIGGRNGGVPEAIAEGSTGLLVGGSDHEELANAIRTLAASPDLRATMGAAGRRRVIESFTWERAAKQLESVHHEMTRTS